MYASRSSTPGRRIPTRIDNLKQIRLLITDYCPAIFGVGCMVRSCNWDGRTYGSAVHARTALQWVLCILLRLSPEDSHKVKYIKTVSLALLMWTPWLSATPGCMHSEEGCEALLSKVTANLRKHPTRSDHDHYFDVFILTKQSKNELLHKKGGLSDQVIANLRERIKDFIDSGNYLPALQWKSDRVCTVGDGFAYKMESTEVPFSETLMKSSVKEEVLKSLRSLTHATPVSQQLADVLRETYGMSNEDDRTEYTATYNQMNKKKVLQSTSNARPTKRQRIASMLPYCLI